MTDHDVDERIVEWLREAAPAAASPTLTDTILRATRRSRQRRGWLVAPGGLTPWFAAAGAAAVLVIAVLWWRSSPSVSTQPSVEPSPVATESESSGPSPNDSPSPSPSFEVDVWPRAEISNPPEGGFAGAWPQDVVLGGPGLVAVGSVSPCCADVGYDDDPWSVAIWTSGDGRRWELVPELETFGKAGLRSVAADADGLMVAAGYQVLPPLEQDPLGPLSRQEARMWQSTNGIDWITVPAPTGIVMDITWSPRGWVAVGSVEEESAIFVSADLESWSTETFGPGQFQRVAAATDGTVVATGCFGFPSDPGSETVSCPYRTSTGPDEPWLPGTFEGSVRAIVAPRQGGFIAVGAARDMGATRDGAAAWDSEDGVAWQRTVYPDSAPEGFIAASVHPDGVMAAEAAVGTGDAPRIWLTHGANAAAIWTQIGELERGPKQVGSTGVTALAFRDAQYIVLGNLFEVVGQPAAWHGP